ncbi:NADPH:quinone oxidoreductase family protein [Celeribacter indicus]|uniref:Zinc-binding alcohol dehydrogenase n=1 Tax=Celeribacter indicus TaxID=1208324 RepID=A0A0B5E0J2_9RHOB|nr:NADPH:quinone oxidoreductase family protein [Celeribacter indicus]AJE49163.1 zinc-binding alcohol dehydrogenase [Celeribacter indicus]SDX17889.1 NADPH2:quinone reductase [Celeribacter indicus]
MKGVVVQSFTPFEEARTGTLPDPAPGPGEVVVDIEASEANYPDILYIEGRYQKKPPFPFSPGLAGAGRVSRVGAGVTAPREGQKVLVLPQYGSHAEKLVAPAEFCFPMPEEMPCTVAAAFGLVYQTAYFALTDRARIAPGERVLVLGATGGIGMAAVQLAKALGAGQVIAATRGAEGADFARALGADATVDSGMENLRDGLRAAVMAATEGQGADVVIDPVGGALSAAALRTMAWCGRLVVVGFASGEIPSFAGNYLLVKNISVSGLQWTDYRARQPERVRDAQAHIFALWSEGRLAPRISATLPLDRITEALRALSTGSARGKIILTTGKAGDAGA